MTTDRSYWDDFATYDNFLLAWRRTVNCTNRMICDGLGLEVFSATLQASLEDLLNQLNAEDFPYRPSADHKVYVPKPSATLRTLSLMSVPDLIVYQAMVNVIADRTSPLLVSHENQHIWGNLYAGPGKRWMLKPYLQQYRSYVKHIEKIFHAGNPWIASTDIVAFYDMIDHERLTAIVKEADPVDSRFEKLFRGCLAKWCVHPASVAMGRGIPQGSNASDFLANLYLHGIDRNMIAHGYQYTRYVDDVRILGPDMATVQQGLIYFDLELKRAGLVAQVTKTSVHQIEDIDKEVNRLKFTVTVPEGDGMFLSGSGGMHALVAIPSEPASEQAALAAEAPTALTEWEHVADPGADDRVTEAALADADEIEGLSYADFSSEKFQAQLRSQFIEACGLLGDPHEGKEAESNVTFCLNRLSPDDSIRDSVLALLPRLPWRSEAVTRCLGRFKDDQIVAQCLRDFISSHRVYTWHLAHSLLALSEVVGNARTTTICRAWLADVQMDWYARKVAAEILSKVPDQHAFFVECLRREQSETENHSEETAVLREQLAYGGFMTSRSARKQLALLRVICNDQSPIVKRLAVYLLQRPDCRVTWDDLKPFRQQLDEYADLIQSLGISTDVAKPCFLAKTLTRMYKLSVSVNDLRWLYGRDYSHAVAYLNESFAAFQTAPNDYVASLHGFAHLTIVAFHQGVLPDVTKPLECEYAQLVQCKQFRALLPRGIGTWERLGGLRNRVAHPVDRASKAISRKISVKEAEDISKELQVALQELFDVWIEAVPPPTT